jgi:beta-glucosidase
LAAAEGVVLLKNEDNVLPILPEQTISIIGHLANVASLGGGGSAKVNSLRGVTPLEGFQRLGTQYRFHPGVPVFGAVPHADPSIVSKTHEPRSPTTEERPIKLEWFNGSQIGQNLAHEERIRNAEYMIKEAWPQYLDTEYCTRLTFDITPTTTGSHTFSVITTGTATLYVDGERIYHREQKPTLVMESFYFFKAKIERRLTHQMIAGKTYYIKLESWATEQEVLPSAKGLFSKVQPCAFSSLLTPKPPLPKPLHPPRSLM